MPNTHTTLISHDNTDALLDVNIQAVELFRYLLSISSGETVYCNTVDAKGLIAEQFLDFSATVSGASEVPVNKNQFHWQLEQERLDQYGREKYNHQPKCELTIAPELQMIKAQEAYHYAFCFPQFQDDKKPLMVEDKLREWNVARMIGKDYICPLHLMLLESCYNAVLPGGYFGAVLPKHWVGNAMKFVKWWNERVALVAKISLPEKTITKRYKKVVTEYQDCNFYDLTCDQEQFNLLPDFCQGLRGDKTVDIFTGNSYLFIWHKTADPEKIARESTMFFATRRWTSFGTKLKSYDDKDIEATVKSFRRSDWNKFSLRPWQAFLKDGTSGFSGPYRTGRRYASQLKSPSDLRIIRADEDHKPRYLLAKTINEIASDSLAVHIKSGPPVKLYGYNPAVQGQLAEIAYANGFDKLDTRRAGSRNGNGNEQTISHVDRFTYRLKTRSLVDNKDWLLKILCDAGLHPYMLEADHRKLGIEARWLDIQLTPIERTIKVPDDEDGAVDAWETLYDDMSVKFCYPEIWNMWVKRAKKMKMDKNSVTYGYQFEDIIYHACKHSILNANAMGLGKTRESLLAALLIGVEKCLIILPTRLVGEWQNEIETTMANYVRRVQTNWMGKQMKADINVIQWAADLKPENISMFNIIAYEKLARVPNDTVFLRCPVCKYVVGSPKGNDTQACPKCNEGREINRKTINKKLDLKKFKEKDDDNGIVIQRDTRYAANPLVMMDVEEKQCKKLSVKTFFKEEKDELTGLKIQVPYTKDIIRPNHLKWTFSHLLRNRFTMVMADETNQIANPDANKTIALWKVTGRRRVPLCGTPVRGFPKSVVTTLNWAFKRSVWPDYRMGFAGENGVRRFEKKYAYYVEREGASPRLIPKINNPELFQAEIAPLMLRHLRNEPNVAKDVPPKLAEMTTLDVPMDHQHMQYYQRWLDKFSEWWELKKREEGKETHGSDNMMVKLGYLVRVSSMPHTVMDVVANSKDLEARAWAKAIGPYDGPPTAKFKLATKMIEKIIENNEKVIAFCWYKANIALGHVWARTHKPFPIASIKVDGSVSTELKKDGSNRSERQQRIERFRHKDYMVMFAGMKCLAEGYNIPEANHGIFIDLWWEPGTWQQCMARMLRPEQRKTVYGTFLDHVGTVDEYLTAWCQLKAKSIDEGIDYVEYDDFKATDVPDFIQYADAIVDKTTAKLTSRMRDAVEDLKKRWSEE